MKKVFFTLIVLISMTHWGFSQEQNKFRVGFDLGYTMPDGGGGILFAIEPKYNVADNMNIGVRFESAAMAKNVSEAGLTVESSIAASASYSATFDYYFNSGTSSFAPFVGGGVGYSSLANIEIEFAGQTGEEELDGQFGGLVRAGFEVGKFRLAATYNLIGASDIDGAEVKNSYFGFSLGFYLGGGKWKK